MGHTAVGVRAPRHAGGPLDGRYICITGVGRSGTNWLLGLFDLAPNTFCRNEPESWGAEPFRALQCDWLAPESEQLFLNRWRDALDWIASHGGERDLAVAVRKSFTPPLAHALRLRRLIYGRRARRALAFFQPQYRGSEYPLPRWLIDPARSGSLVYVLKINAVGWLTGVLLYEQSAPVIQIVRHPGGFLNSWRERYLHKTDEQRVWRESSARLRTIADQDPTWVDRFGDIDGMGIEELEVWYWCYATETIYAAGSGNPNFHRLIFERLAERPVDHMRGLYKACGLSWNPHIESQVVDACRTSTSISSRWVGSLDSRQIELVDRVLAGTKMADWWDDSSEP